MARLVETENLAELLRGFSQDRDWIQFHAPKNLALALVGEVGELCAELQWLDAAESSAEGMSEEKKAATAAELADVMIYLVRLADRLDIDLNDAVVTKMAENAVRYPVSEAYGSAAKAKRAE